MTCYNHILRNSKTPIYVAMKKQAKHKRAAIALQHVSCLPDETTSLCDNTVNRRRLHIHVNYLQYWHNDTCSFHSRWKFHTFVLVVHYLYWPLDKLKSKANNLEWTQRCILAPLSMNSMRLGSHKILHKQCKHVHIRIIYVLVWKVEQFNRWDAKERDNICLQL